MAIIFSYENKKYQFYTDKNGMFNKINISRQIEKSDNFSSTMEKGTTTDWNVNINTDPEIFVDFRNELQYIEASMGLDANVKKIFWEDLKINYIPENEEERQRMNVLSISQQRVGYVDNPVEVSEDYLKDTIKYRERYDSLTVLQAFYNEGNKLYKEYRYITAFYNFYFILEDVYGGGKIKNRQIENNFIKSEELKKSIEWVMRTQIRPHKKHYASISHLLNTFQYNDNVEDIIKLLINMRGRLHHYSSKSTITKGTPLNQRDFESFSFLTSGIAIRAILNRIMEINLDMTRMQSMEDTEKYD